MFCRDPELYPTLTMVDHRCRACKWLIPIFLIICAYSIHSFALNGHPTNELASLTIPRAVYPPSSPSSSPIPPYFSSCSLACFAYVVMEAAQLVWLNISGDRWDSLQPSPMQSIETLLKGVIWLLLATASEVPPVVTLTKFSFVCLSLISTYVTGIHPFEFEWYFISWSMLNAH